MKNMKNNKAFSDIPDFSPSHSNTSTFSRGIIIEKRSNNSDSIPNLGKKMADGTSLPAFFKNFSLHSSLTLIALQGTDLSFTPN